MILSGLRVFSIVDPANPVEIAYYNAPSDPSAPTAGSYAMASPSFVPDRDEIWYSDGHSGFHVVRLADGVWPAIGSAPVQPAPPTTEPTTTAAPSTVAAAPAPTLPSTGGGAPLGLALAAALSGAAALWLGTRRRTRPT
jgi:LPXTG-motif cell wall-anchored protein